MALPNYLAKIKSSGIYRFVWDKSEIPAVNEQTLRLVVGYSDKGPFNTPVYIDSVKNFKTIFGDINKKLERHGVFFHRNALQCLNVGPIVCLNLKKFKDFSESPATDKDRITYMTFNTDATNTPVAKNLNAIFNTDRFWSLEPEKLDTIADTNNTINTKYITICSTDDISTSKTVIIRGCGSKVNSYNVTFKSYFEQSLNGADLPEYLEGHENDLMSDYFAEIYVFKGEWTTAFKNSQEMQKYFTNGTLNATVLDAFGQHVDTLDVMASDANTGFVNKYQGILLPEFSSPNSTALSLDDVFNADSDTHKLMMHLNANLLYNNPATNLPNALTTGWLGCLDIINSEPTFVSSPLSCLSARNINLGGTPPVGYELYNWDSSYPTNEKCFTCITTPLSNTPLSTTLNPYGTTVSSITLGYAVEGFNTLVETQSLTLATSGTGIGENDGIDFISKYANASGGRFIVYGKDLSTDTPSKRLASINKIEVTIGVVSGTTQTVTVKYTFNRGIVGTVDTIAGLPTVGTDANCLIMCNKGISDYAQSYTDSYLPGYTYSRPVGTASDDATWIKDTINALVGSDYKGIREALTNNIDIEYHYLVDTFESKTLEAGIKNSLAQIAKEKDNCLALLNWPSYENTKDVQSIAQIVKNETFKASAEYQSWVNYLTPVKMKNPVTNNKFNVPSAALVSNCYMEKYRTRFPYSIVAGPNFAILNDANLVGPDFNYSREELDLYEPYGVNCLVYKPRKGTYVNSNQTAKQKPVTTLSKVSTREIVIYLQDEIEKLLTDYQWEFNTQALRDIVKGKADVICAQMQDNGAIFDFKNICDESNNTDDVINNEMFVLSTSIEPIMGAGKMIQELTLYRKGGMSSKVTNL